MTYQLLGQSLWETADFSKKWFANAYGASNFVCEIASKEGLPLAPTWQAKLKTGYILYINVQSAPYIPTLADVVNKAVGSKLPIKLWVAIDYQSPKLTFAEDLKRAAEMGIGVVQFDGSGNGHEFHRAVPLSLYALRKVDFSSVPKARREILKNAQSSFLDGSPADGCQEMCQELEYVTRTFAEYSYKNGMWKSPAGSPKLNDRFFRVGSWSKMLDAMYDRLDIELVKKRTEKMSKATLAGVRSQTDWRNSLSHKPKTVRDLQDRDQKLRTMFELAFDMLETWYSVVKPFKVL